VSLPPLVHCEPAGLAALKARVEAKGWPVYVPVHHEKVELR
jgi:metallo-beta-lactamase family protein